MSTISGIINEARRVVLKIEKNQAEYWVVERTANIWWKGDAYEGFRRSINDKKKKVNQEQSEIARLIKCLEEVERSVIRADEERARIAREREERERRAREQERKSVGNRGR